MKLTDAQRRYLQEKAQGWRELAALEREAAASTEREAAEYDRLAAKRNLSAAEVDWIVSSVGLANLPKMDRLGFVKIDHEANHRARLENAVSMRNTVSRWVADLTRDYNKSDGKIVPFRKH